MPINAQGAALPDFTGLVEKNRQAVVNISTTQKVSRSRQNLNIPELPEGTPFDDFFRKFFEDEQGGPRDFDSHSLGSGFIISNDGYVLTNNHVIKDADEIIVRLNDRRVFEAQIIGTDPQSDVALLKIKAKDLPVTRIGKAETLKVGEWVLAIGSPFGFDYTVTAGIVSAKGRSLPSENYVPFIQTDVAINPGNSGGPLFNLDGEVVGVNSQIYSRTGGFMGLSFAIPIEVAMDVAEQLKATGHVARGWLGVLIQDVTRELAESFGMDTPRGALISKILDNSPASQAGFKVGDIIVEFNGKKIDRSGELPPIVGRTPIGNKVPVNIMREGKRMSLRVKVGELPDGDVLALSDAGKGATKTSRLGISVTDITGEKRKQLDVEKGGVQVTAVDEGPARQAGVRKGDVILSINNLDIDSARQFRNIVAELPKGKTVPLLIQRRGNPIFLALKTDMDE